MNKEFCIELYKEWSNNKLPISGFSLVVKIPQDVLLGYLAYGKYLIGQQS